MEEDDEALGVQLAETWGRGRRERKKSFDFSLTKFFGFIFILFVK